MFEGLGRPTKRHETAVYLFDTPEKRASQMQVARQLLAKWGNDPAVLTQIQRLNVKAKLDGVATLPVPGG